MASLGPLESFVFPGAYTQTRVEAPNATAAANIRYAAIIGVGNETEQVIGQEIVRGSSSSAANAVVGEDLANNGKYNVVDGVNVEFLTKYKPIVGKSAGTVVPTTLTTDVVVTVDGQQVPVQSVDGKNGIVTLVDAPLTGQLVEIAYYQKLTDTYVVGEDLSAQAGVTGVTLFEVNNSRIVKGNNGGELATDDYIGKIATGSTFPVISAFVNSNPVAISHINSDGSGRTFTLASAPAPGQIVTVNYFTNDYANTYDLLPTAEATDILAVGYNSDGTPSFNAGTDYMLTNKNQIHWGNSVASFADIATTGATALNDKVTLAATLDDKLYFVPVAGVTGVRQITLAADPVRGDGTGRVLTDASSAALKVYVASAGATGTTITSAPSVTVAKIEGRLVTLEQPIYGDVYASYFVNYQATNDWTITKTNASVGVPDNTYTVTIPNKATAYQVRVASYPSSAHYTGYTVGALKAGDDVYMPPTVGTVLADDTVTVTVSYVDGTYTVSSTSTKIAGKGILGQTFIDNTTGFTLCLQASNYTLGSGNGVFTFTVKKSFQDSASIEEYAIPGIKFSAADTTAVTAGDTVIIRSMAMNFVGDGYTAGLHEPAVGSPYYASFNRVKTDYSVKYLTNFTDVQRQYGALAQDNPIVLGAWLAFLNGAPALALKQIKRTAGQNDAAAADYTSAIDIFDEPLLINGTRPSLIQPLTTDATVISYLKVSNAIQSSIRYRNERTSYFGFRAGTTMDTVINRCKGLASEFLTGVYPATAAVTLVDKFGQTTDVMLPGQYIACAMAGADLSPSRDVATPLTNVTLTGFTRLGASLRTVDAQQIASAGCTVLEYKGGVTRILMALTTDMSSPLTRDPRIIEIKHDLQKGARNATDPFVGQKGLPSLPGSVARAMNSFMYAKKKANIIYDYKGISAKYDSADPTVVNVEAYYKPIFGVNWIIITFNISTTL